jgi:hypothetical protein
MKKNRFIIQVNKSFQFMPLLPGFGSTAHYRFCFQSDLFYFRLLQASINLYIPRPELNF